MEMDRDGTAPAGAGDGGDGDGRTWIRRDSRLERPAATRDARDAGSREVLEPVANPHGQGIRP